MKKIICLVLIFTMMLTACSKWNVEIVDPTEKPSESLADIISGESDIDKEDEETIPVYPITEDMLSIDATGLLRYKILYYDPFENAEPDDSEEVFWVNKYPMIYIYEPYQCKYEVFEYKVEDSKATLNQLVNETVSRLNSYIDKESFKVSVSVHKNMAVVDFYDTTDGFWGYLMDEKQHNEFLNSIAMTIYKAAGYDPGFTLEGGKQFKTDFITLNDDGYGRFEPVELYAEISGEEYAELRATFPYDDSWKEEMSKRRGGEVTFTKVYDDSVTLRPEGMDILLLAAGRTGAFKNSNEISDRVKVSAATDMLDCTGTIYAEEYTPAAKAISEAVMDDFIPQEWVEEFVKEVFGPEATVNHVSVNHYTYHAEIGVYTPPHMGGWAAFIPYIFDVKETAEGYEAEVAYVYIGMGGYGMEPGAWYDFNYDYEKLEDDPAAMDFIENKLPRYKVNFKKTDEGKIYIASCKKLPVNMEGEYFAIMQKYIAPIHYLAVGESWSDINEVSAEQLFAAGCAWYNYYPNAEYLNEYYKLENSMQKNPEGWEFERFAMVYTEDQEDRLHELPYYNSKTENYIIPEDLCFGEERYPVVTYVYELDDTLSIYYDIIDSEGNYIGSRELRIKFEEDKIDDYKSRWKYLACYERE